MQDLDVFLTSVESKLRGPFSSLELAKAVQTTALKQNTTAVEYLQRLSQVLHRADKITQLRILIGLLALDPDFAEQDEQIDRILTQAQESPTYDEWVRVVSGLVQGLMFTSTPNEEEEEDGNTHESLQSPCRGKEANELLDKTCDAILESVSEIEQSTASANVKTNPQATADADPTFAPYRYALLNADLLEQVIPDINSHSHFETNAEAEILLIDSKLDRKKRAAEEKDLIPSARASKGPTSGASKATPTTAAPSFPGFRSKLKTTATKTARPKSSMFMTARKPTANRTNLHTRKAGAAQSLVGKGRARSRLTAGGAGGVRGRALTGTARARGMKMIDVQEVQGLSAAAASSSSSTAETKKEKAPKGKVVGKKRKAEERAAPDEPNAKKAAVANKPAPAPGAATTNDTSSTDTGALASAALSAYRAQVAAAALASPPAPAPAATTANKQQDWRQMLKEKSNRLTAEDRFRVQQFFVDHFNPTPDQPTYKMKLHEQRTNDPNTGEPVKETYYLELDYSTFTSRQSKKIKRYAK